MSNGYLLDTCAFSEYKKKFPDQKVLDWIDAQIEDSLFMSVLTLGEIKKGIVQLPAGKKQTELEQWFEKLRYRFERRVLPLDSKVLFEWGVLCGTLAMRGRVLPVIDSLIAATALVYNLAVVTDNSDDFADTNVLLVNPWK